MLFNRDGYGADEIVASVGLIATGIDFAKWDTVIPFGIRDVAAIVGREPVEALARFYEGGEIPDCEFPASTSIPLGYLKQAVAFFSWLKIIPTLDAQHDDGGRSRRLGENEKGLTALQEFKDEENITRLAYEAVDALVEALDRGGFEFWTSSPKFRQREGLLIQSKEEFDQYYTIGSHRLFVTLTPIMREVQDFEVLPVIGDELMNRILKGTNPLTVPAENAVHTFACRAVALLTMKKAVERLPVEVIPEGVVQIQQSQPVKSRLKAEQQARTAVAAALGADADRCLDRLAHIVATITGPVQASQEEVCAVGPIVHSKGMSF